MQQARRNLNKVSIMDNEACSEDGTAMDALIDAGYEAQIVTMNLA